MELSAQSTGIAKCEIGPSDQMNQPLQPGEGKLDISDNFFLIYSNEYHLYLPIKSTKFMLTSSIGASANIVDTNGNDSSQPLAELDCNQNKPVKHRYSLPAPFNVRGRRPSQEIQLKQCKLDEISEE